MPELMNKKAKNHYVKRRHSDFLDLLTEFRTDLNVKAFLLMKTKLLDVCASFFLKQRNYSITK